MLESSVSGCLEVLWHVRLAITPLEDSPILIHSLSLFCPPLFQLKIIYGRKILENVQFYCLTGCRYAAWALNEQHSRLTRNVVIFS